MRVGMGYDVHRLVQGRRLILGGVDIPHTLGLDGHSDADVLTHAVMDALLGAAHLGDIGLHFPDTDERYRGISSMELLAHVGELISENRYVIENIDATVIAQRPKIRPYIQRMEECIAETLGIGADQVSVKATTEEHLGFTGREEGIAAEAVCLLSSIYENSVTVADSRSGCAQCPGCTEQT
ncbi:MAG: 2-C-methyl-D-erythritol 2,4-cyclodiphosphate synthase [Clostridiales bacterium]|nr:2-C-methyl-D-erythritol 2,4-cyclodiphosphate synthase [Clostridiales bacterium]